MRRIFAIMLAIFFTHQQAQAGKCEYLNFLVSGYMEVRKSFNENKNKEYVVDCKNKNGNDQIRFEDFLVSYADVFKRCDIAINDFISEEHLKFIKKVHEGVCKYMKSRK